MGTPHTSSQFAKLLEKGLTEVMSDEKKYMELKSMIDMFFNRTTSNSAFEEYYGVGATPDIPVFNGELSPISVSPGFLTRIEPKEYGAYMAWERKFIDDEQYGTMKDGAAGMVRSAYRVQEKSGVRVFANAQSSAFDFMVSEEGVALSSSSHATKSGASTATGFDNAGTSALNKTNLAATRILMQQFKNDLGERVETSGNLALVVPSALADTANEIVGTPSGYDTAASDKNVDYQRYKVIEYPRLDDYDANDWSLVDLDRMKRELLWIDRIKPETNATVDFHTLQSKASLYMRFGWGWKGWRWLYNHKVT